jgi:hypothetical protein
LCLSYDEELMYGGYTLQDAKNVFKKDHKNPSLNFIISHCPDETKITEYVQKHGCEHARVSSSQNNMRLDISMQRMGIFFFPKKKVDFWHFLDFCPFSPPTDLPLSFCVFELMHKVCWENTWSSVWEKNYTNLM